MAKSPARIESKTVYQVAIFHAEDDAWSVHHECNRLECAKSVRAELIKEGWRWVDIWRVTTEPVEDVQ